MTPAASPTASPLRGLVIRASLGAALIGGLASGCSAIGPTGANKSTTAIVGANDDGLIVLKFKIPTDATKAKFQITNKPEDSTLEDPVDDSPDGTDKEGDPCEGVDDMFCVAFAPGDLASNVYLVDVLINEEEEKAGTLAFVVSAPAAEGEGEGEGEGDGEGEGEGEAADESGS